MKKICSMFFAMAMALLLACVPAQAATSWPSFGSSKPLKTYTISTGNNTTAYTNTNLNVKKGTIYASDELHILSIGRNGSGVYYAYCTYPVSGGRKDAYIPLSVITTVSAPSNVGTATASITVYRRSSSGTTLGTIAKNDKVYRMTASGSRTQVVYNTGSASNPTGWKMGWIDTANYNKYVSSGSAAATTTSTAYNPQGVLDNVVSSSAGTIRVQGWAFDRNNLNSALEIHVYVGGQAGSGAPGYKVTANTSRVDVNNAYPGVGNNHGFDSTINVSKTGTQTIYVYAINVGGGGNVLIGQKSVTIKSASSSSNTGFDPIWPCKNTYTVSTLYKYSGGGVHSCHFKYGMDIAAPKGEAVVAVEAGTVIESVYSTTSGFGNYIKIQHANGKVSLYAHLSERCVGKGTTVKKGDVIGKVGNTSAKYSNMGYHLHFELGNSNTSGAAGDPYREYYKNKYAGKISLIQAAAKYNTP